MADLEERANKLEADNLSMKESLARAAQQEQQAAAERTRLYSEIGQLREKVCYRSWVARGRQWCLLC